jgi:two-component system, OmpR family, phosphate regulon sensor histidine kinase PhoR
LNLFWRSNLAILALVLVVVAAGDLYSWRVVRDQARDAGFQQLAAIGRVARLDRPDLSPDSIHDAALHHWLGEMQAAGVHASVLTKDGRVLEESASGQGREPANAQDPEIQEAFAKGEGRSMRRNDALHRDFLYYAVSYPDALGASTSGNTGGKDGKDGGAAKVGGPDKDGADKASNDSFVLRLALPLPAVDQQFAATRRPVWTAFLVLLASAIFISLVDAHNLSRRIGALGKFAGRMAALDFRPLVTQPGGDELEGLARALNESAARLNAGIGVLTDERNRSAAILGSMIEGVAVISESERILFSNRAFSRILGLQDAGEIEGRALLEVARQSDLLASMKMALGGQAQVTSEIVVGTVRPRSFAVTAAPVQAASHKGAVLVLHEITELRRLERVRQDFVANVSHEFRTPLTAIQGFAETLLGGALEDPINRRRFVEIIREHAMRLARLTEDLLKLSRIEAGQLKLEFRPVSVAQLIDSCMETAQLKAVPKRLSLAVQMPAELPPVRGDANSLQEVLQNLLDNALQYTPAGGKIEVSALSTDSRVVVTVADTGIGIPQVEQERIFESFYRVDAARSREAGGTGLGLSIARHIMEAHGGHLWVESAVGEGSRFHFSIPIAA